MQVNQKNIIPPIEMECVLLSTPFKVFRSFTSQNGLRKWWAPHVSMSRNRISQEKDKNIKMELLSSKENHFAKYSWAPEHDSDNIASGSIIFTISNLGASRQNTGDGLLLEIIHDGWTNEQKRMKQENIWKLALKSLKSFLEDGTVLPWWEKHGDDSAQRQIKIQELKQIIDGFKKHKKTKKIIWQKIWKLCSALYNQGKWFWDEGGESFNFQCNNKNIMKVTENKIHLFWKNVVGPSVFYIRNIKERFSVEQDIEFPVTEEETIIDIAHLQVELFISLLEDLMADL